MSKPVELFVSLGYHDPVEVPSLRGVSSQVTNFFSRKPRFRNVYFKEDAACPKSQAEFIAARGGRRLTYLQSSIQAAVIELGDLPTAVLNQYSRLLLSPDNPTFFQSSEYQMLDRIPGKLHFQLIVESVPDSEQGLLLARIQRQDALYKQADDVVADDLVAGEEAYLGGLRLNAAINNERNVSNRVLLRETADTILSKGKTPKLFQRIGINHGHAFEAMRQLAEFGDFEVVIRSDYPDSKLPPRAEITTKMEQDPDYEPTREEVRLAMAYDLLDWRLNKMGIDRRRRLEELKNLAAQLSSSDVIKVLQS